MTEYNEFNSDANKQDTHDIAPEGLHDKAQDELSDEAFDAHVRGLAHEMKEQMHPTDQVVAKTLNVRLEDAHTATQTPANTSEPSTTTPFAPTGSPLAPTGTPLAPTGTPLTFTDSAASPAGGAAYDAASRAKKRRRNRILGSFAAAAAFVLVVVGGVAVLGTAQEDATSTATSLTAPLSEDSAALSSDEITTPGSYDDIYASLEEHIFSTSVENSGGFVEEMMPFASAPDSSATESLDAAAPLSSSENAVAGRSGDYSQTNTQVEGVDEADIVKTDGTHIYSLYDYEIAITEAKGADTQELARITIKIGTPSDLYIVGDRLVIMAHGGGEDYGYTGYATICYTHIYDISDPAQPKLLKIHGQDGYLNTSRLVNGTLYVVSVYSVYQPYCDAGDPGTFVPYVYEGTEADAEALSHSAETLSASDVRILPDYSSAEYTVVSALDVQDTQRLSTLSLLGNTSTVYMNENNLFLTATGYEYDEDFSSEENVPESEWPPFLELRLPLYPWDVVPFLSDPEGWLYENNRDKILLHYSLASPAQMPHTLTRIARIDLKADQLDVVASAVVEGYLLNQFSLDEYNGYLRMAVTTDEDIYFENSDGTTTWAGTETANALLILDGDLTTVGSIEDLAPDERIYSVRFTGEVGYMVTFRQTDPLFALDLSDPANPVVMDALKIPGFSQYLHPYADGLLLGLGQETDESGITTGHLKLSMFDTSNPFDLHELNKTLIESSYSPALYNHKAVLIDQGKDLIGFEVEAEIVHENEGELMRWEYKNYYVIYGYETGSGFYERAVIELPEEYAEARALYIDNHLYIVYGESIGIFTLDTFEEIAWVTR